MIQAKDKPFEETDPDNPMIIPEKARVAISQGVGEDDAVAEMEYLGLPVRTINILEGSKYQITSLKQLVSHRQQDLLQIPNFGEHGLREVMQCLARYHELSDAKHRIPSSLFF